MTIRNLKPQIRLNVPAGSPPLMMEMESFFEFNFWLAEELLNLEVKYSEWQTPNSNPLPNFDANGLPEDLEINFENC